MKPFLRLLLFAVMVFALWWTFWRRQENVAELRSEASTETRLLLALDDTHTGLIDIQQGTTAIAYANGAACDIFGYKSMAGEDVGSLLPELMREAHAEHMRLAMVKGAPSHISVMRCVALKRGGEPITVVVRVAVSRNGVQAMVNRADEISYADTTNPPP